jgi:hypothetical protein
MLRLPVVVVLAADVVEEAGLAMPVPVGVAAGEHC